MNYEIDSFFFNNPVLYASCQCESDELCTVVLHCRNLKINFYLFTVGALAAHKISASDCEAVVKTWLKCSGDRSGGRKRRAERQQRGMNSKNNSILPHKAF